jgi:hypothetical protein
VLLNAYRTTAALEVLEATDQEFADMRDEPAVIELAGQLARAYFFAAREHDAIQVADRVLAAAERNNLLPIVADTLITKGSSLALVGRAYEGLGTIRTGLALAEAHGLTDLVLRGLTNLSSFASVIDPRVGYEAARDGLALARRLGWAAVSSMIVNFAELAIRFGEWRTALDVTTRALERKLDLIDWLQLAGTHVTIQLLRGAAGEREVTEVSEAAASLGGVDARMSALSVAGWQAMLEGRFEDVHGHMSEVADISPNNAPDALVMATRVMLWLRDETRARASLDRLDALGLHGAALDSVRRGLLAGLQALGGRPTEAIPIYREVLSTTRDLGLRLDEVMWAIDMVRLLGPDQPEAAAAADRAREIIDGLGGSPLINLLTPTEAEEPQRPTRASTSAKAPPVGSAGS